MENPALIKNLERAQTHMKQALRAQGVTPGPSSGTEAQFTASTFWSGVDH